MKKKLILMSMVFILFFTPTFTSYKKASASPLVWGLGELLSASGALKILMGLGVTYLGLDVKYNTEKYPTVNFFKKQLNEYREKSVPADVWLKQLDNYTNVDTGNTLKEDEMNGDVSSIDLDKYVAPSEKTNPYRNLRISKDMLNLSNDVVETSLGAPMLSDFSFKSHLYSYPVLDNTYIRARDSVFSHFNSIVNYEYVTIPTLYTMTDYFHQLDNPIGFVLYNSQSPVDVEFVHSGVYSDYVEYVRLEMVITHSASNYYFYRAEPRIEESHKSVNSEIKRTQINIGRIKYDDFINGDVSYSSMDFELMYQALYSYFNYTNYPVNIRFKDDIRPAFSMYFNRQTVADVYTPSSVKIQDFKDDIVISPNKVLVDSLNGISGVNTDDIIKAILDADKKSVVNTGEKVINFDATIDDSIGDDDVGVDVGIDYSDILTGIGDDVKSLPDSIADSIGRSFADSLSGSDSLTAEDIEVLQRIIALTDDRMSLLSYPTSVLIKFFSKVMYIDNTDCIINVPQMDFMGQRLYSGSSLNLSALTRSDNFKNIYFIYRLVANSIITWSFFRFVYKKGEVFFSSSGGTVV